MRNGGLLFDLQNVSPTGGDITVRKELKNRKYCRLSFTLDMILSVKDTDKYASPIQRPEDGTG